MVEEREEGSYLRKKTSACPMFWAVNSGQELLPTAGVKSSQHTASHFTLCAGTHTRTPTCQPAGKTSKAGQSFVACFQVSGA